MARIKLGPLITDISGSIGMATIQRNRFGHTLRLKPLPKKSETPAQYSIRRHMITIQAAWQSLTDANRLQWDRFLNFSGQTIRKDKSVLLSGHKLYIKYQLWRLMCGLGLLTSIAYLPMPAYENFLGVTRPSEPEPKLRFTGDVNDDLYFFIFKISSPRHENQAFTMRGMRWMNVIVGTTHVFDITTAYLAAFGAILEVGDFVHYSLQYFSVLSPVYTGIFTGKSKVTFSEA